MSANFLTDGLIPHPCFTLQRMLPRSWRPTLSNGWSQRENLLLKSSPSTFIQYLRAFPALIHYSNRRRQQLVAYWNLYIAQKSELRCELATTAISVSISIDGWTSPTRCAMFAIVAHWITGEWEAREALLHIAELPGSHTGVALAQEVLTCLRFYDIKKIWLQLRRIMRAMMPP
ncbi:hypothetical protein V1508DRAFT_171872 [Lipomyces doorenjongii]|uniref:uncharacterized protein n=1 Tax=Lipomyces doorenjongii TaxID=383834 RepID=UPI0034D00956